MNILECKIAPWIFLNIINMMNNHEYSWTKGDNHSDMLCLCWGLMSQSTIFQSCRDGATASWVINQYFRAVKCLAQGHNTAVVGFEPWTSRSGVWHSTTEPPHSPHSDMQNPKQINHSYPPLKLFHAEVNMNTHEYSWSFMHLEQNLMHAYQSLSCTTAINSKNPLRGVSGWALEESKMHTFSRL